MLQVGIRAMSVLSGPKLGDSFCLYANGMRIPSMFVVLFLSVVCFPVVCDVYGSTVGTCFGVPFF